MGCRGPPGWFLGAGVSRPTIVLPYGAGLDRDSGVAVVEPTKFEDLRNVILEQGKAELRKGHLEVGNLEANREAFGKVWQVDVSAGPAFVDETTDANDTDNADWTILPAADAIGDYVALGFSARFSRVIFDYLNGTAGIGGVVVWEYWNGATWVALAGVVDATVGFTAAAADGRTLSFTVPTAWATLSLNGSDALYFIRARITTVFSTNPVFDQGFIGGGYLDAVIGLHPIRQLQQAVGLGYRTANRFVHLNRLTGAGAFAQYIDDWFTADDESGTPHIILADQGPRVFMAHDEPIYSRRAMTAYYEADALLGLGPLNPDGSANGAVETDLNGDGDMDQVRFRGVVNHLKYIFGWGYGTATDPDMAHVVRVCFPGESLRWRGDDYFLAGSLGVPVVACQPCGGGRLGGLAVFKEYERHHIYGYDRASFAIDIAEPYIGCANGRLAISVGGSVFFWSLEGPRVCDGPAPSVDLALPLNLKAPEPADLVASGEVEDGFAQWIPALKCVVFVFGRRIYCLSLRVLTNPRWSYWELPTAAFCSAILYTGGATGSGDPPSAYVSGLAGVAGP